jgi:hypothetical protein
MLLALVAAVFIIVLIALYEYNSSKGTYEAVFSQTMSAGATIGTTTGATTSPDITAVKMATSLLIPGGFTASSESGAIAKALAAIPSNTLTIGVIPSGTPVLASDFASAIIPLSQLGSDQLISLSTGVNDAVGGSLTAGDYVDIYLSSTTTKTGKLIPGALVTANIQIVAIHAGTAAYDNVSSDQASNRTLNPTDALPTDPVPGIYIVQATPTQAAIIAAAEASGQTMILAYVAPPAGKG